MKWSSWLATVFLFLAGCQGAADDVEVQELKLDDSQYSLEQVLERHREALGGAEALANVKTVVKTGSITAPDFTNAPVVTIIRNGSGYLRQIERPSQNVYLAWDGSQAWQQGARTDTSDVIVQGKKESLLYSVLADVSGPLLTAGEKGYEIEQLGTTGDDKEVVQVTIPGLGPRLYFLDGETFLLSQVVEYRDPPRTGDPEMMVVTRYTRYREVDGVTLPYFETTKIGDLGFEQSLTWDTIEINTEVDESRFLVPGEKPAPGGEQEVSEGQAEPADQEEQDSAEDSSAP
jgi:hypothetical protein